MNMTQAQALELLKQYNCQPFHLQHAYTLQGVMRYFAKELGYGEQEEFWGLVGLLHDLDFEQFPEEHCIRQQQIMRDRRLPENLIHATCSHGYGSTVDIKPEHEMEKILYAVDELTV